MSNSKRNPLLSDDVLSGIEIMQNAAWLVRERYEHLITEGKLRVVEEVEWTTDPYGRQVCKKCYEHNKTCKKKDVIPSGIILKTQGANHCPGCGQPIKKR